MGKSRWGKGTTDMIIASVAGLPLAARTASTFPDKVTPVQTIIDETLTVGSPRRIIWDRACNSDPLDQNLAVEGIRLISPHQPNHNKPPTQDGRPLLLLAWLKKIKRVITHWDYCVERHTTFVYLTFSIILLPSEFGGS